MKLTDVGWKVMYPVNAWFLWQLFEAEGSSPNGKEIPDRQEENEPQINKP